MSNDQLVEDESTREGRRVKVKELLSDESKWTKGAYAKDENGRYVSCHSSLAVSFCLIGSIERCYGDDDRAYVSVRNQVLEYLNKNVVDSRFSTNIVQFNDRCATWNDVKTMIDVLDI